MFAEMVFPRTFIDVEDKLRFCWELDGAIMGKDEFIDVFILDSWIRKVDVKVELLVNIEDGVVGIG